MKNTYAFHMTLATFLMLAAASIMSSCHKERKTDSSAEVPDIEVSTPEVDSVTLHKTYPGTLAASDAVDVVGRVSGTLLTKNYTSGQYVTKGQVLFTIEDTKYRNAVSQARAALATAESQLEYATRNHNALSKALESDAVSQMEVSQALSSKRQAAASVENARAALSQARTNLAYCVVRAPISGYTTGSSLDPGSYVGGEGSPVRLCSIYDDSTLIATFSIADSQYEEMVGRNGGIGNALYRNVPLLFESKMPHSYAIDLYYEAPAVSTSTGTLDLKGTVANKFRELKPGMYVTVSLPYDRDPNAMLVRDASIGTDQLGKYMYVVNDSDKVVYTPVKVSELVRDSLRIVTSGISPKDRYVTKALLTVRSGMKVRPVASAR